LALGSFFSVFKFFTSSLFHYIIPCQFSALATFPHRRLAMPALAAPFAKFAGYLSFSPHPRHRHPPSHHSPRQHFWPHLPLILLVAANSLFGTPLGLLIL
jgi:hypothetical protein